MSKQHKTLMLPVLALVFTASGCASSPSAVEQSFGSSVRQMVAEQTHDHEAANRPVETLPLDGQVGENVLDQHRSDVAKPADSNSDIVFNIGNE